jgi:adenine-specific DNA methylase
MNDESDRDLKPLAIEGKLPLKAVGIENLKEDNPKHMPPHRYLHPWFARRPTPAARLAILSSVLPADTSGEEILDLMQIGPKEGVSESLSEYVENKKATEDSRSGTLGEHYGYSRIFERTPSEPEREELHKKLREQWGGNLPKVLDPTAGGGVIPFESLRYGLPTEANELNPVPTVILETMLRYPLSVGHLREELTEWADVIDKKASQRLEDVFPASDGTRPSHYACAYSITCPSCGCEVPVVPSWWLLKRSASKGIAVQPQVKDNEIEYELVTLPDDVSKDEFNPQDGPRSRGGNTECISCNMVIESDQVKQLIRDGEYENEILGVKCIGSDGTSEYRAATAEDYEALEKAEERVSSDYEIFSLLDGDIPPNGQKTSEAVGFGLTEWRDFFSPRQLLAHYEYWQAFEEVKSEVYGKYTDERAEAIVTILSLASGKLVDRNSRLSPYDIGRGYPGNAVGGKNYTLQWLYVDNNPSVGDQCYQDSIDRIIDSYELLVKYISSVDVDPVSVVNGDAADLPYDDQSIQCAIVDPPYYSSIMYSELSDIFYVWLKKYLNDVHADLFKSRLTEKEREAVANPSQFADVETSSNKKGNLAKQHYEEKMSDIFSEIYRSLEPGGVMTVMFTHKESDAWDTLTMSLINSGFVVTSTHPITSEMPDRLDTQESASADSTLLLTGRKPHEERDPESAIPTLWSDVEADTRAAAKEAARDLLESGVSLTKTDVIISAFGPTLRVYADAYPVVNDQDEGVPPRKALETAREAVTQVLVEEYLEGMDVDNLDDVTEWYILCWLVHESEKFAYDDGHQLGLGIGVDIGEIKRSTKTWRKSRGDIILRGHGDRVQNIMEKPEDRLSSLPVNPDNISFSHALDAVHAAMHVYDKKGENACIEWLRERNFDSDTTFKETLKALLQVLPQQHEDWELARDLAVGRTQDTLDLDFSPNVFANDGDETSQSTLSDH